MKTKAKKYITSLALIIIIILLMVSIVIIRNLKMEEIRNNIREQEEKVNDNTLEETEKEEKPQIGDKVAYDEGKGKKSSIDSKFVMKNMEWRILDIQDDGTIELISTQPTDSKFKLSGKKGWLNAEKKLDTLCNDLYANGKGVTARSLKIEDINKLGNYEQTIYNGYGSRWQYQYSAKEGYMQYRKSTDNGSTWSDWTNIRESNCQKFIEPSGKTISSSSYLDSKGKQIITELIDTCDYYNISSKITSKTLDGISIASLITQGLNDDNNEEYGTNITQWTSSSCIDCYPFRSVFCCSVYM